MSNTDGTLSFATGIDTSGFQRGAAKLQGIINNTGTQLSGQLGNAIDMTQQLEGAFKRLAGAVGIGLTVQQAWNFASTIRDVRSEIQSLEISFETLLGSKDKADALFGSIREFAVNTPMQLKDLASSAQMMLSFNIDDSKVMDYLKALGDVSMGDTQKFQSLSLAFSQMSSAGKLMGQDLLQMINAGFNPLAQISEKTGKSISELRDEMSAGKISAEMVQQAFIDATSEGGKFYKMLDKQSMGIVGAMSNLQGAIDGMFNELGSQSEGLIVTTYTTATEIVKNWKTVAEAIGVAVTAYGVYKAAVMTETAMAKTVNNARYEAEAAELQKIIALKEADANADITSAISSGKLTAAKGEQIIATRAEAAAVVESLRAKAQQAKLDLAEAVNVDKLAQKRLFAAVEKEKAAQMELRAAEKSGSAFEVAVAKEKLATAQTELNTAQKEANAAMTDVQTKRKIEKAAVTTAETAADNLNTAAEAGNTAATSALTVAKEKLIATLKRLWATMTSNPYVLVAAAVAGLVYGIYKLCTAETEAEKAQKRLNQASQEAHAAADAEVAQFKRLFDQLKQTKEGTEEFKTAKQALVDQFGQYFKGIDIENAKIKDLEAAYDDLTAAIRRSVKERALDDYLKKNGNDYAEKIGKQVKDAYDAVADAFGENYAKRNKAAIRRVITGESKINPEFKQKINKLIHTNPESMGKFNNALLRGNQYQREYDKMIQDATLMFVDEPKPKTTSKKTVKNNEYWENQKKEAEAEWKALDDAELKSKKALEIKNRITEADKHLKARSLDSSGKSSKSGKSAEQLGEDADAASEKLSTIELRNSKEYTRLQKDLEFEAWQARIDAGQYGAETYIQQRELDFQKEQEMLTRQMEDAITAEIARQKEEWDKREELEEKEAKKKKQKYTKKAFDSDNLSAKEFKPGDVFEDKTIGDVEMSNIYEISKQYGDLMELLKAKHKKALDDEQKTETEKMNEYLAQWGKYAEKRQAIIDIANAKLNNPDSHLTEGERKSLVAQMTKDLSDLDMEATKTTNSISMLFADMEKKSVAELRKLANRGQEALDFLKQEEFDEDTGKNLGITKEMWTVLKNDVDMLERIKKAIKDINKDANSNDNPFHRLKEGFDDLFKAGDNNEKLIKALRDINEALGDIVDVVNVVSKAFSSLGDAFGSDTLNNIAEGLDMVVSAVDSAMSAAMAGGQIAGMWGAVAGAAVGLISSLTSSISKLIDKGHEKKIEDLQDQIEVLERSYDALGKEIEKAYSKDASQLIDQQNEILEQKRQLIELQKQEEEAKKNTDDDKIKSYNEQLQDLSDEIADNKEKAIDAIFGEDLQSAIENFADAYADAWAQGENRTKSAKDTVRNMMKQMVQESIKAAIQSSGAMEQIRNKLTEFYADNVLSDWEQQYVYNMAESLQKQLDEQFGWADSLLKDSNFQQDGSSGGFQAMSEDTASELNGRFTALQISGEKIANDTMTISASMSTMREGMTEIQNIGLLQLAQLEVINKNTNELYEMNSTLEKIRRNTQNI